MEKTAQRVGLIACALAAGIGVWCDSVFAQPATPSPDGAPLFDDADSAASPAPHDSAPTPDAAAPREQAAIAGPQVAERAKSATLVRRTFEGGIERLETTPEEAAIEMLGLSDQERARALAVLGRRSAAIESFVSQNALLLQEIGTASEAGEGAKALGLISRALERFSSAVGSTPLLDQLCAELPEEKASRLRTLTEEYWNAVIDEGLAGKRGVERALARPGVLLAESFACLQREIERGFAEAERSGSFVVETIIARVNASQEQARQIRAIAAGLYGMGDAQPTQSDIAAALKQVYRVLDEQQRETLFDMVVSGEG